MLENNAQQGLEMEEIGDDVLGQIEAAAGIQEESPVVQEEEQPPVSADAEPVQEEDEPREVDLLDVLDSLNAMQDTLERVTTLFAGMVEVVTEVSTGITELSAASVTASAAAGDGKSSGPINPVVLKLAIQAAMTAAIPELSKMLRGQIAAVKMDLQAAAAEDARIVENNKRTVQEYSEHRKNITQEA